MFHKLMVIPAVLAMGALNVGAIPAMAAELPTEEFAVVNANGGLNKSSAGVVTSVRQNVGRYEVRFNFDVDKCAYQATLGLKGKGAPLPGEISVATSSNSPKRVAIRTFNSAGTLTDKEFHLYVACN